MISELYNQVNYNPQIPYIFSNYIREYDISKANISILFEYGAIDREVYERLKNSPREVRQKEIGLMEKYNPEIYKIISAGIIESKKKLFTLNNIQDYDILTIKNDAVFIVGKYLTETKVGEYIEFCLKNTYTSFVNLSTRKNPIELYYMHDRINNIEKLDIKGLGKNQYLHEHYLTDFICYIIQLMNDGYVEMAISVFNNFYKEFISLKLETGYYREYNSESMYNLVNSRYKIFSIPEDQSLEREVINKNLNIKRNTDILRNLFSYISTVYFSIKK